MIEAFGGPPGVRDKGLLESALFRPQTGYYNDPAEMSAALFESLIMNHAFVDGNEPVAFFTTDVLLRLDECKFSVDPDKAHAFLIGLLERQECRVERLLPWIRQSIVQI